MFLVLKDIRAFLDLKKYPPENQPPGPPPPPAACQYEEALPPSCVWRSVFRLRSGSELFDVCAPMCVCMQRRQSHRLNSASPPQPLSPRSLKGRARGPGTGATSKPGLCRFHGMKRKGTEQTGRVIRQQGQRRLGDTWL